MSEDRIHVMVHDRDRTIRADYTPFGPYVELTFGSFAYKPTEVINVWDYESNRSELEMLAEKYTPARLESELRDTVASWIATQDDKWPEWYEGYLENARY